MIVLAETVAAADEVFEETVTGPPTVLVLTLTVPLLDVTRSDPPMELPVMVTGPEPPDMVNGPAKVLDSIETGALAPVMPTGASNLSGPHAAPAGPPMVTVPAAPVRTSGPPIVVLQMSALTRPFPLTWPSSVPPMTASAPPGTTVTVPLTEPPGSMQVLPVTVREPLSGALIVWVQVTVDDEPTAEPM